MEGFSLPRQGEILGPSSVLVLLILFVAEVPSANGACEFPASWAGEWYHYGKQSVILNSTALGKKICDERMEHRYIVYEEGCYQCMIINDQHENVIQYREGWCVPERTGLDDMCSHIRSDDTLYSMFRVNSKPIPCPFSGSSFTFTYDKGYGECTTPISLAEKCTDESKLLLKYQACPDIYGTESNTKELQCLAAWHDGRNKYLVGTLEERSVSDSGTVYRCFLYEEKTHHQGKAVYLLAQSGDTTCNGLTTVSEGSLTIKLTKVDKEHNRCRYPSWITEHHDWHSLDGTKVYHFTNKNATLKVKVQEGDGDAIHEEKIVCHNLEKLYSNDNTQGYKVKLVAHVTSGCDIGYICMIFHKRDNHVIELQQSSQKAIMPDEACTLWDPATMPYTTLITPSLHERKCPNPGRYTVLGPAPLNLPTISNRQRRSDMSSITTKRRTWQEDTEDEECRYTDVQVGCTSTAQNKMIIGNTCAREETAYFCHGSWEEKGTWYTIVTQKTSHVGSGSGSGQTLCFSMRFADAREKTTERNGRLKRSEQELWLSRPERTCRRPPNDHWIYRLTSQGVCEDVTKAFSSLADSFSLSKILFGISLGACIVYKGLLR